MSSVVCLAPSGAGRSYFRRWPPLIGDLTVTAVSLPGRDDRFGEPLPGTVTEAVAAIRARIDSTCVVYGHSLGAVIGFELARAARDMVRALVVSGRRAPDRAPALDEHLPRRPAQLRALVEQLGCIPPGTLADPGLMSLIAPALRADLALSAGYQWDGSCPLDISVTALAFAADPVASGPDILGWRAATTGPFGSHLLAGDHTAPAAAPPAVLSVLEAACRDHMVGDRGI